MGWVWAEGALLVYGHLPTGALLESLFDPHRRTRPAHITSCDEHAPVGPTILAAASMLLLGSAIVPAALAGSGTSRVSAITESEHTMHGELRCTVTFPSATLQPGEQTDGRMKVTNTTDHDVMFYRGLPRGEHRRS